MERIEELEKQTEQLKFELADTKSFYEDMINTLK